MKNKTQWYLLLAVLVFLSRLPFLFDGYGSEDDSWGLVLNAQLMAKTGEYSFSRLPGHPVQEYVLMLMPNAGAFAMNLLSALFSVIAVLAFAEVLRFYRIANWFLWSLVFACIPIIWISSIYTIDYIWALAFILLSWRSLLHKQVFAAGVLLGLAIACRITSGAVLAGFAWIEYQQGSVKRSGLINLLLGTFIAAAIFYLPSWLRYGWSFFDTYRLPYPSVAKVFYKATFGVWGLSGIVAVAWLKMHRLLSKSVSVLNPQHSQAMLINTLLYTIAFMVLPQKSAFWIPAIPFLLVWLLEKPLNKVTLFTCSALLISSPLMFGFNLANAERGAHHSDIAFVREVAGQTVFFDPLNGPLQIEQSRRINRQQYVASAVKAAENLTENDLVLCGWWTNQFTLNCQENQHCKVQIGEFYDRTQLDSILASGTKIWYLSEIDRANDERYLMDYTNHVARLLE